MRKIKTFNVDEDVYNGLLAAFRKYGVNASLSSFVNNCLSELLDHLQDVETVKQKYPESKLPISFVISEMTKSLQKKKSLLPILFEVGCTEKEIQERRERELLTRWGDDYEAQKLGISVEMYSHLKGGGFFLAPNKQYLIEEKTGKKYFVAPNGYGRSVLLEIKEE
jgi:hypothetical protein